MKNMFKLKVNYKNKGEPLVFIAEGSLKFCCDTVLNILCDEICLVIIKQKENKND